jgi:hypothetical protein
LIEQWLIEQYWPVGEPAANYRALIAGSKFGYKDTNTVKKVLSMIEGVFKPKKKSKEMDQQMQYQIFKNFFNS